MARVPSARDVALPSAGRDPGVRARPSDFGAQVGESLFQAGGAVQDIGQAMALHAERKREAERTAVVGERSARAVEALGHLELELERTPSSDFQTIRPTWDSRVKEIERQALDGVEDRVAQARIRARLQELRASKSVQISKLQTTKLADAGIASLDTELDVYSRAAAAAANDAERLAVLNLADDAIASRVAGGILTEVQAGERRRGFDSDVARVRVQRDIRDDPEGTLERLLDESQYGDLEPEQRESLLRSAEARAEAVQRERLRQAERAEKAEEERIKTERAERTAAMMVETMRGGMTEERLVEALRTREITTEQFNGLKRALDAERAPEDDPIVALNLRQEVIDGSAGPGRVFDAFSNGLLTQETAEQLLTLHSSVAQRGSILSREDVKRWRGHVDQVVGGVRGPLAVLDTAASARLARADVEFVDRVQAGEDPREVAMDVAERYRSAPPDPTEFPRPLFLVGQQQRPDIDATRAETLRALEAGEIDRATAARELENLDRIEDALDVRQQGNQQNGQQRR